MSPFASDDLTEIVVPKGEGYAVMRSPDTAGRYPDYVEVAEFSTRQEADARVLGLFPPISPRG